MINQNELRFGNFISRLDLADQSKRIEKIIELSEKAKTTGPIAVICDYSELKPVEITEEIMLNCKQYTKWQWFGEDLWGGYIPFVDGNKLMIRKINDKFIFTICTINKVRDTFCSIRKLGVKIKYLHELQNLYFSFRGEELVFSSTEP